MSSNNPLTVEVTRGDMVESRHMGACVVVDAEFAHAEPSLGSVFCGISDPLAEHPNVDLPELFSEDIDRARRWMVVQGHDPHQRGLA